jgi:secondary thiamine-phosphate synthase enzyme
MVKSETISLSTRGNDEILDITSLLEGVLKNEHIQDGIVTVFVPGSTAAITTIEYESGVLTDLKCILQELIPRNRQYNHDAAWGDGNGFAHLRASLIGPSLTIPFSHQKLMLGTWQQVVFIDFDNRPRQRSLIVQIIGE